MFPPNCSAVYDRPASHCVYRKNYLQIYIKFGYTLTEKKCGASQCSQSLYVQYISFPVIFGRRTGYANVKIPHMHTLMLYDTVAYSNVPRMFNVPREFISEVKKN